jgi:hypothetical protein
MIFLIVILVILTFVVLWNFDLHKIIYTKARTQNAGDAAAVAAARWQGISLNLIGDLNLMHALALSEGNSEAAAAVTNAQARLCYVGPMIALMAAQEAAKNNGIYSQPDFSAYLHEHADVVRYLYPMMTTPAGEQLFPEPYQGCWLEYANMLDLIAKEGVAAAPDNMVLYTDRVGGHMLLRKDFYQAVAGKDWCWFYHNAPTLLDDYQNFFPCWWPPLPDIPHMEYLNSEIFGLGMTRAFTALSGLVDTNLVANLAAERGLTGNLNTNGTETPAIWYCYGGGSWGSWGAISSTGEYPFPLTGTLKPQYDYVGADAVVRIEAEIGRMSSMSKGASVTNVITWTAAAKPFGYLNEEDKPNIASIVLPAFRESALIPVDTASGAGGGGFDLNWRRHIEHHLPSYMANGPSNSACAYCQMLVTWEKPEFRESGSAWLSTNSWKCTIKPVGGGGGGGTWGGTQKGH